MNDETFIKIQQFVEKERWKYDFPLTRKTSIEKDLGITGDDADEFLLAFAKKFNVDVSQFRIGDYFEDEGDPILPAIVRLITGKKKKLKKVLTLGHLEKAAKKGRLDEEVINS